MNYYKGIEFYGIVFIYIQFYLIVDPLLRKSYYFTCLGVYFYFNVLFYFVIF